MHALVNVGEVRLAPGLPTDLVRMLKIPGLGPKKVKALHDLLRIDSLDKLKAECENGSLRRGRAA